MFIIRKNGLKNCTEEKLTGYSSCITHMKNSGPSNDEKSNIIRVVNLGISEINHKGSCALDPRIRRKYA